MKKKKELINNWQVKSKFQNSLNPDLQMNPLCYRLLELRGIEDSLKSGFLSNKGPEFLSDPFDYPDMEKAVEVILNAIDEGRKITVYGDYDVDGMTASTILTKTLKRIGADADYYIPSRMDEGYGLNREALDLIRKKGTSLVITVDCGISGIEEADYAKDLGLDLIITDHHQAPEVLPKALALINPVLLNHPGPKAGMAGAGVAFFLARAIAESLDDPKMVLDLCVYAALGTIADIVPLIGDNRIIVSYGLEILNGDPPANLLSLMEVAGVLGKELNTSTVAFGISPRLNAAGRMDQLSSAMGLLMAEDGISSNPYALALDDLNRKRQDIETEICNQAIEYIESHPQIKNAHILTPCADHWHQGVIGIVASKMTEKYHKPCLVITNNEGILRGSGRSIDDFNIYEVLESTKDLLSNFGGHKMACGFGLELENLEPFRQRLEDYFTINGISDFGIKCLEADLELNPEDVTLENAKALKLLEPFGTDNPRPLFVLNDVLVKEVKPLGKEGKHLRLTLEAGTGEVSALLFNQEQIEARIDENRCYDFLFSMDINVWKGRESLELFIKDVHERPIIKKEPKKIPQLNQLEKKILPFGNLRDKQIEALNQINGGNNTLCCMATGRGKSLIFQMAALNAPEGNYVIAVYPLRALASDQYLRFSAIFPDRVYLAWGGLGHKEKNRFFVDLVRGKYTVVVTTPEFLEANLEGFGLSKSRISLFVVDECHHLAEKNRPGYLNLSKAWKALGKPVFLGTTATLPKENYSKIAGAFEVGALVKEEYTRENLQIVDARETKDKISYLLDHICADEKALVFVNSQKGGEDLRDELLKRKPELLAESYHGGLLKNQRKEIEKRFSQGKINLLITTSAFGEGTDISDIRQVYLYHLPFSAVQLNQLAGRAGRDGQPSVIHLLYGKEDEKINRLVLSSQAPGDNLLRQIYGGLKKIKNEDNPDLTLPLHIVIEDLVNRLNLGIDTKTLQVAIQIFDEMELMLLEEDLLYFAPPPPQRLQLSSSSVYLEVNREKEEFEDFLKLAYAKDIQELLKGIQSPILP